jgi:hypothetical protein
VFSLDFVLVEIGGRRAVLDPTLPGGRTGIEEEL